MSLSYRKIQLAMTVLGIGILIYNIWELVAGRFPQNQAIVFIIECLLGILLIYLPEMLYKVIKIRIPEATVYFYWFFLLISVFLGTCLHLILIVNFWDKILHTVSPMVLTAIGYGLIGLFLGSTDTKKVSPWLFLLFGFAFAGLCGVLWEFWEFACDQFGAMNLQRYETMSGKPFIGRSALMDTMGDLFTNTLGALIMSVFAAIQSRGNTTYFLSYRLQKMPEKERAPKKL